MLTVSLKDSLALLRKTFKLGPAIEAAINRDKDEGDGKKKGGRKGWKKVVHDSVIQFEILLITVLIILSAGYTTKFVPQSISLNSDFSSATWSMTALSAGTDDIVAQSDVTPEEASGVTKKEIADLLMQIEKCKSAICFSPVLPESSSGGTRSHYWLKIKGLSIWRDSITRPKQREVTHRRRTSVPIIKP